MASRPYFFYDGRVATLKLQALVPIEDPIEMHLDFDLAIKRINEDADYIRHFEKVFASRPDSITILRALAEFQRNLESDGSAPYDQWINGFDDSAINASQIRGRELFLEKTKCFDCHFSPDFTGDEFRNVGLYDGVKRKDRGRFDITKDSTDLGKFKVPGLRNVVLTAPYMHDGEFKTLEPVLKPSDYVCEVVF